MKAEQLKAQMCYKTPRRKYIFPCGLILLIILIAGIVFVGFYVLPNAVSGVVDFLEPAKETIEQQNLKKYLNISLPATITNFHGVAYNFMQSRIIGVRFQISPTDLDKFLNDLGFTAALQTGVNPFHPNSLTLAGNDWWTPETAKVFVGGSFTKPESFYDVLVDQTNPEQFAIYMMVEQI